jgi:hypothetical protein
MRRFITCVGRTLGSAAALALAVGCSHESRPAETPAVGTSSPPFESNVPPAPPGTPGADKGTTITPEPTPGQPAQPGKEAQPGQPDAYTAPGAIAPPSQAGTTGDSEHMLCNTLATEAKLRVEDVQNGVAIVFTPKAGHDLSAVRDDAHQIETSIHQPGTSGGQSSQSCGLLSVGRLPSVTTTITEGMSTVRLVMTTSNPSEIKDLRRNARDQVSEISKMPGSQKQP